MKKFLLAIALMAFGTTVSFAQNAPAAKTEKASKKVQKAHKDHATMYECPMKCEPASAKAGKCSKCGMDLVAVKAKKAKK
jgi:hypothetical protein